MIRSRKDYLHYLDRDRRSLGVKRTFRVVLTNDIWRYQRNLRRLEYLKNSWPPHIGLPLGALQQLRVRRLGRMLGFSIPANVFGAGLSLAHAGTVVVNEHARIGENCRVHVCVNIGASVTDGSKAPRIGNDCYIGPGVKIFGSVAIGDNVGIGANAVVNRSFGSNLTIAGVPASVVSERGPRQYRPMQ